jgi:hypothetical protein
MRKRTIDPDERDRAIGQRIRDAEGAVALLVFRLDGLVRHAETQEARGHAALYQNITSLLAGARTQLTEAADLMEQGDPEAYEEEL